MNIKFPAVPQKRAFNSFQSNGYFQFFVRALLGSNPHIHNNNLNAGVAAVPGLFSAIALFIKEVTLLVSYVKNNAFPQPLAEDEEEKHLRLMAEGNHYSRNLLIEHNLRLVAHIVILLDKH